MECTIDIAHIIERKKLSGTKEVIVERRVIVKIPEAKTNV